ncbi:NADPH:quinone oxidoreductase [Pandoraea thiooxydans]|uniref:Enoyl reductase (ER) domain-containing protein n=1 Tax=Pandoraea thiooxydans TaxID=445709 RepID=A0A0G3ESS7_9BURK|nr:NAD(P)-dependent alcohol dehydrogenase [Pandoraea thiooxydans]AKJ67766.1 NADPH:quinone oxidoreductase [Pandoraea thiooxydans]APR94922.1 NADPH:quinone oxidoreductase [Pandoraea thiooxydans]
MKSYHASLGAGIAGISVRERQRPAPGPGEVLIRIHACALNARELMILRGYYTLPVKPDVVLLADGAGEIIDVGTGVVRHKVGDRVAGSVFPRWIDGRFSLDVAAQIGGSLDGMLAEFVVANEDAVVRIPDHLSFEQAATLPCAGVTAWNALTGLRPPSPGDTVLTLGSGSVSLFALAFAKMHGARVIATTSSDAKAERLRRLGADAVLNYRADPQWHAAVRELTGGRGVDHVIEVGGGGTLEKSLKSVAIEGQIAIVGWLANQTTTIDVRAIAGSVATMRRVAVGSRAQFEAMNRAISAHLTAPVIDRVFDFADTLSAFRYFEAGNTFGKVVVRLA